MRKGALDISLYPMPYAGGELPETNIGLMPGLVSTYDQGLRWKKEPVGKALTDFLADKGIILLSWVWQAGGVASRSKADRRPRRRQGTEGPRRLARNGHGAADRRRRRAVGAVERNLRRDADRRLRRRHHLLHQPDLVPPRGGREIADLGRRRLLLVHAGAADDVEGDLRQIAQEPAGHHAGGRHRTGSLRQEGRPGRRCRGRQGLREGRRQGQQARRRDRRQVARHCARYRLEGLWC